MLDGFPTHLQVPEAVAELAQEFRVIEVAQPCRVVGAVGSHEVPFRLVHRLGRSGPVAGVGERAGLHRPVVGHSSWGGSAFGALNGCAGKLDGLCGLAQVVGLVTEVAQDARPEHPVIDDLGQP